MDANNNLNLTIRADITTKPIEVNIQSTGVAEEEQFFFTEDDYETEQQMWERKLRAKQNPANTESTISIETMATNIVKTDATIKSRLSKTSQIAAEQTKDGTLVQLKAKIQGEDYSEMMLHQDIRYKHYLRNANRIVLREEILAHQYFDETGQVKRYQVLIPQHLVTELLESLHGHAHKHPGIAKMLQEVRQKYYYPGIAKLVKK